MKIKLDVVLEAIECADDAFTYYYDTETESTVFLQDPLFAGESNEELEELIESNPERFYCLPTKYDIHEYSIMEDFVDELPSGRARNELASAIHGKGAFRRFKTGIIYHRIEQEWYTYRDNAYKQIAIRWCEENEIEYEE